jgi:hypothetical protein
MDREKAEVYEIMGNMIAKMFLVLISAGVFVAVTCFLLYRPNWYFAAFDSVCGYTIGKVILHYFPARSEKRKAEKKPKPLR